jgi:glutaredoxin-related protein
MKTINEQIVEKAWLNVEEIVYLMKGTAGIPAEGMTPHAILQLLKDGWSALPF